MSLNILVVDDSETVRAVIAKTLRLAQVPIGKLIEATNGKEALDVLAEEWVDLVFVDINMPVMNGVELIERMATDGIMEKTPVIVVSTEGSKTRIDALREKGITGYVRKPFTPEEFGEVVSLVTGVDHG